MSNTSDQDQIQMSKSEFHKLVFISNALDKGWTIKKMQESYIFTKKHEGKREIFQSDYLEKFIHSNSNISTCMI